MNKAVRAKSARAERKPFPIIGVGASAGGIEALSQVLTSLPPDPGVALVVVQHLDPTHESFSVEILSRKTQMRVTEAKDGDAVEPDHVYVIPPNYNLAILRGVLKLVPRTESRGQHLSIDYFFQSLAQDQKSNAIGVIVSGTASDGTQGLEAIKAEGGLTIAQEPKSAKYDGMPRSAISSGTVDLVLPPQKIAEELVRVARHPLAARYRAQEIPLAEAPEKDDEDTLSKILILLRNHSHVDFSLYKPSTIQRRIARRMVLSKSETLENYLRHLQATPDEAKALFADLLINVTGFFRDPDAFAALKSRAFPQIIKNRPPKSPIRIWVVGCATGEEVYSVAMALLEFLGDSANKADIQIFATDISEPTLRKARSGTYPFTISKDVSEERLSRFFVKTETGYRISKLIRDICLFSRHDITTDPPFAKLDLICCRNLLIYFDSSLQKRALATMHYALNPNGFLWLGRSESIGGLSSLFGIVDKANKLYSRRATPATARLQYPKSTYVPEKPGAAAKATAPAAPIVQDVQREAQQMLLSAYAPPGVVVNGAMEIVLAEGDPGAYLKLPPGQVSLNLFKMARPEIVTELRMALQTARKQSSPIKRAGLTIEDSGRTKTFSIKVMPFRKPPHARDQHYLILFEQATERARTGAKEAPFENGGLKNARINELTRQLTEARDYQQSVAEDYEATQEKITSANEELQSANEELQSANEELETAKEELQSTNEELTTVNEELQNRNTELTQVNNDLTNLLASVEIPIVITDSLHRIRRFTPKAAKIMNLIPTDVGRPVGDIKPDFDKPDLSALVSEVMETIAMRECDVQDREGRWFRLNVRPYKTADNRIDGVVIALFDINLLKRNLADTTAALDYRKSVANSVQQPLVVLSTQLLLMSANEAFYRKFGVTSEDEGKDLLSLIGADDKTRPHLGQELSEVITSDKPVENLEIAGDFAKIGHRTLLLSARRIQWIGVEQAALLLSLDDVTESRQREMELREARSNFERANQVKDAFLATLSHELRTPLTAILSWAQLLRLRPDHANLQRGLETIEQSARTQGQLIEDLLDISRIQSGKLSLNPRKIDPSQAVRMAIESVRPLAEAKSILIETHLGSPSEKVVADPARLQQIVWNLLTNAIKFSSKAGRVQVRMSSVQERDQRLVSIQVIDQGKGIEPDFLPRIFERFTQADSSATRVHGGLGLGLAIVRDLLRLHGGSIRAESGGPGKGATFTAIVPSAPAGADTRAEPVLAASLTADDIATFQDELSGIRVLIVDDEPTALDAFSETLKAFGAIPVPATSAAEAFSALSRSAPDILVSDIAMPGEDGYSLIRRIRALEPKKGGKIPALALTAYAGADDVQRALSAGFDAHLAKPFDAVALARLVAGLKKRIQQGKKG